MHESLIDWRNDLGNARSQWDIVHYIVSKIGGIVTADAARYNLWEGESNERNVKSWKAGLLAM